MDTQTKATQLIAACLNLKGSHPHAPPADLLKLVFGAQGPEILQKAVDLCTQGGGQLGEFADLVMAAADKCMSSQEWRGLLQHAGDDDTRSRLIAAWRDTVGADFVACFGAQRPPTQPDRRFRLRSA